MHIYIRITPNPMKKITLGILLFAGVSFSGMSQELSYGLKGGGNYSLGGQITGFKSGTNNDWAGTSTGQGELGIHAGVFLQFNFGDLFLRPEIVYTSMESTFEFPRKSATYAIQKFDIPFLLGYDLTGPLSIYAGPSITYLLDALLEGDEKETFLVVQKIPVNAQIGALLEFGNFGVDIRYEHSLFKADAQTLDILENGPHGYGANMVSFEDTRLHQVIFGVTYKFTASESNRRRYSYDRRRRAR